jgi:hypothetical protein
MSTYFCQHASKGISFRTGLIVLFPLLITITCYVSSAGTADGELPKFNLADHSVSAIEDYFNHWFDRVDKALAEQPQWITPVVTVSPTLTEGIRYDQLWQHTGTNSSLVNFGAGKGLELIPAERVEAFIQVPPYEQRWGSQHKQGIADWPFFFIKYQFARGNEQHGNYAVTGFLQATAPVGISTFTSHYFGVTPTLAFGKGFGDFDVQMTIGDAFPIGNVHKVGAPLLWNTVFQYRVLKDFWPEIEFNTTYFPNGPFAGKTQVFMTPGLLIGKLPIYGRLKLAVGVGYQFPISEQHPQFNSGWVLSVRLPF